MEGKLLNTPKYHENNNPNHTQLHRVCIHVYAVFLYIILYPHCLCDADHIVIKGLQVKQLN